MPNRAEKWGLVIGNVFWQEKGVKGDGEKAEKRVSVMGVLL